MRVVNGRVVTLCRSCEAAARGAVFCVEDDGSATTARELECECGALVSLLSARIVVGEGEVELRCAACGKRVRAPAAASASHAEEGAACAGGEIDERALLVASTRRAAGRRVVIALLLVLTAVGAAVAVGSRVSSRMNADAPEERVSAGASNREIVSFETEAYVDLSSRDDDFRTPEEIPEDPPGVHRAPTRRRGDAPLPHANNEVIQHIYAAHMGTWVHPVAESARRVPERSTRLFGAVRPGERPRECGGGHCGVDLEGPRGTPILAVRDGTVARIVNDPNRPSGKYVKLLHDDGTATFYMHLDEALGGLMPGDRVDAGDIIGSLGVTGINSSVPHLHFAFRLPIDRGDRYIDPAPLLATSRVLGLLEIGIPDLTRPPATAHLGDPEAGVAGMPAM